MDVSKTNDFIQIKIKMSNPSKKPPVSSKAQYEDLKDMDVLCTFKIKIESQHLDHGCVKDQWPYSNQVDFLCTFKIKIESQNLEHGTWDKWQYPNQDKDAKP